MVRYMDQPTLRRTPWTTLLWYLRHPYLWGTLLAAATMFVMGRWLRSDLPASAYAVQGATV